MRHVSISLPEIGLIAATRGLGGAGVGLLLADRIPKQRRLKIALPLLAVGVLSTIPLIMDVVRKSRAASTPDQ